MPRARILVQGYNDALPLSIVEAWMPAAFSAILVVSRQKDMNQLELWKRGESCLCVLQNLELNFVNLCC